MSRIDLLFAPAGAGRWLDQPVEIGQVVVESQAEGLGSLAMVRKRTPDSSQQAVLLRLFRGCSPVLANIQI